MKWDKFAKTAGGEKTKTTMLVEAAYLQILKRKRYGTAMDITSHAAIT